MLQRPEFLHSNNGVQTLNAIKTHVWNPLVFLSSFLRSPNLAP